MVPCKKKQIERSGDAVTGRCLHRQAGSYQQVVTDDTCSACPLRQFVPDPATVPRTSVSLPVVDTGDWPTCEFRYRRGSHGVTCGVTNLGVDEDKCRRCAKDDKMETARLLDKVVNYAKAVRQWVAAGRPERTDEEAERLFNEFCNKCSMYNREKGICNSCGCPANTDQPAIKNKLKMATESCPLGQFGPGV